MNDLVSIVVPVYKVEDVILHTLQSIVAQTYKNIELILVNDGTPDRSIEIAEDFLKDKDLSWNIINDTNHGVSHARNIGISKSRGHWIACIDSDDYINPFFIERLLHAACQCNADIAFCQFKNVCKADISSSSIYDKGIQRLTQIELIKINLLRSIIIVIPGMIVRRDLYQKIKFDEGCPYSEDTLFTWELLYNIKVGAFVDSDLYNYYVRPGSKQHTLTVDNCDKAISEYKKMIERIRSIKSGDNKYIDAILPKFIIAAHHVLARCVDYKQFIEAYKKTEKKGFVSLLKYADLKLSIYIFVYLFFPWLYYKISK